MCAVFSPLVYTLIFLSELIKVIFQLIYGKRILKKSGFQLTQMSSFRMHMLFPLKERAGNA